MTKSKSKTKRTTFDVHIWSNPDGTNVLGVCHVYRGDDRWYTAEAEAPTAVQCMANLSEACWRFEDGIAEGQLILPHQGNFQVHLAD